jgi:hypothetical protein
MIEKQQNAWDSVEPIIDRIRKLHQGGPTIHNLRLGYRTHRCTNALAGGDTTLCFVCRLKRDLAKRSIIPKEGTITDPNDNDVLCGRGRRNNSHVGNV